MKFDENLVVVHSYLCADGYVVKNPKIQKHKYYRIGLRNTNLILLKDFQRRFEKFFEIRPHLRKEERCEIGSKKIYEWLTKEFGSFYSNNWEMPKLDIKLARIWLRSFFDCEGWVFCKSHQNRHIGLDSINEKGINQIIESLKKMNIKTIKKINKKRKIYRIYIYGKDNLTRFKKEIGFLHPNKSKRLNEIIEDYVKYIWNFPDNESRCKKFVNKILKDKIRIRKLYYLRIISKEEINLKRLRQYLKKLYDIESLFYQRVNGLGTRYYELNINKKEEIEKLIKLKLVPNLFKLRTF